MLELQEVFFSYGQYEVIKNVSFEFEQAIYGLLGLNGAGKSTLFSLIVGNLAPVKGKIRWNGTEIASLGERYRENIGYKPQSQGIYPQMKVTDFLAYFAALKGISKDEKREQIESLIHSLNLYDHRNKRLKALSGGMLQRALLAQALLGNPKILLLDEPTAGLDPLERINMLDIIQEISKERTVIMATHLMEDVNEIADQTLFLTKGELKVIEEGENLREIFLGGEKKRVSDHSGA